MAMRLGDSLLLSTSGVSRVATVGKQGRAAPGWTGGRAIRGGVPRLQSRVGRNASRQGTAVVRATKSGSVDMPESSPSTSSGSPAQSHFDLLERMTEKSAASQGADVMTIRDQLASQVEPEAPEVVVPLAIAEKDAPVPDLTISQKRNIRRQNYLNKVSERNDAPFFATVAGFILVPPILILGFAVAAGYVELFP